RRRLDQSTWRGQDAAAGLDDRRPGRSGAAGEAGAVNCSCHAPRRAWSATRNEGGMIMNAATDPGQLVPWMDADLDHDRRARMAITCIADAGDPAIAVELERIGPVEVLRSILAGDHGPALAERATRLDLTDYQTAISANRLRFVVPGDA